MFSDPPPVEKAMLDLGLLKGSTPAQFDQLRHHFLGQVDTMFPAKKRSKRPALPSRGKLLC